MAIPGDHWPIFLYAGYDYDPDDPWKGLHQEIVDIRLSLYKALNLVYFQTETSELQMARYSLIRDNIVDQIEQKNKKDGMWSDGTSH